MHYKALSKLCETGWISCVLFTYCRQESAIFSPHIHTTWEAPFSADMWIMFPPITLKYELYLCLSDSNGILMVHKMATLMSL